ncbi:MAG: hypothetical protein ACE15F_25205 [bacterium]
MNPPYKAECLGLPIQSTCNALHRLDQREFVSRITSHNTRRDGSLYFIPPEGQAALRIADHGPEARK